MKKYIAKTNVSINIVLPGGKNRHITFSALTGGGSVYYTDDADIISAIERHYKYGSLFRADVGFDAESQHHKAASEQGMPPAENGNDATADKAKEETEESNATGLKTIVVSDADAASEQGMPPAENGNDATADKAKEETEESNATGLKTIVVSDADAAKAYLAEHFGYSRTKLKSVKSITEAAASNGIVFEGI